MNKPGIAVCDCGNPLIKHLKKSKYICMDCDIEHSVFDLKVAESTPELRQKLKTQRKRFEKMHTLINHIL